MLFTLPEFNLGLPLSEGFFDMFAKTVDLFEINNMHIVNKYTVLYHVTYITYVFEG